MNFTIYEDNEDEKALTAAYAKVFEQPEILDQVYKKITPSEFTNEQHCISNEEQTKFQAILEHYKVRFNGELGLYSYEIFVSS